MTNDMNNNEIIKGWWSCYITFVYEFLTVQKTDVSILENVAKYTISKQEIDEYIKQYREDLSEDVVAFLEHLKNNVVKFKNF